MLRKYIMSLALVGLLFIITGCGGGGNGSSGGLLSCGDGSSAPEDATITVSPATESIIDGTTGTAWDTYFFSISVKNSDGIPLDCIKLNITYPWAIPSEAGLVQFFDGDTPKDNPMTATTDDNGTFYLKIRYQRGEVAYTGNLMVVSGAAEPGTATFEVKTE
ncbi:MAG: hypothetical protein HZC49_01950 [Nitrospirae bacterium]|nr:hypothetical protein [Nitrospirota bacterium]